MNLYSMQAPKLKPVMIRIVSAAVLFASVLFAPFTSLIYAQSPVVLSAANEPLVFELPSAPNLTRQLNPHTTAKLATPAQHQDRGLAYPLWLSDANFAVRARAGQRQSVVVEAKRGNPDLSTDLLLALNNKGVRSFEPSTLIFDKINHFVAAAPLPPANLAIQPDLATGFADLRKTAAPIHFPDAPPKPTTTAHAAPAHQADATQNVSQQHVSQNPPHPIPKRANVASSQQNVKSAPKAPAPITFPAAPAMNAPQAAPDMASQPLPPAAQATPALSAKLPNAPSPKLKPLPEPSWLDDWPLLASASAGLLLVAYLVTRLMKKRDKPSGFEHTRSPPEQVANTVFGISDKEAEAMHKKWLSEQLLSKNNM
jgi:hypothetical protein